MRIIRCDKCKEDLGVSDDLIMYLKQTINT